MKNLRRKHNGFYYDHGGKPRRWEFLGKDETAALARYAAITEAPKAKSGSVDAMLRDVIDAMRDGRFRKRDGAKVAPGTLANYESYRKNLAEVFVDPPDTITQAQVVKYMKLCPRMTFRNEIGLLSLGFVHWMDEGRLDANPCYGVRSRRQGSKRTRLLSAGEIDRIIAAADERTAVAIELAYATGLRISDLIALRWSDLKDGTLQIKMQKTGNPIVFAADALDEVLAPIIERARALQAKVATMFVLSGRGARQWSDDALRNQWNKAIHKAGVKDAHFHDIRAAAATECARRFGQDAAQHFLGHKDAKTTQTYLRDRAVATVQPLRRKA